MKNRQTRIDGRGRYIQIKGRGCQIQIGAGGFETQNPFFNLLIYLTSGSVEISFLAQKNTYSGVFLKVS